MLSKDDVGHVFVRMEQRHLGAKSRVALDCVSNSVILVNDEVVCENSVNLQFLCESVSPGLDLLVIFVGPIEARGCRLCAGVETNFTVNLDLASRPH